MKRLYVSVCNAAEFEGAMVIALETKDVPRGESERTASSRILCLSQRV